MFFSTLAKHGVEIKLRIVAYDARKVKLSFCCLAASQSMYDIRARSYVGGVGLEVYFQYAVPPSSD